ncbi:MAG TPA: CAP domain-containing protein, partial [Burkholderiaceae bacterium]
ELRCEAACRERDAAAGAIMVAPVADVEPAESAAGRVERSLARLNALRTASGTHPVARSELLSLSASRHAAYLSANGFRSAPSVHAEAAGLGYFTGADPFSRMRAAGYHSTYATEVVGDIGSVATDSDCVDHLMGTVYHATLLLSRVTEAGMAYGSGAAAGACVIDLGVPLLAPGPEAAATGRLVRYPWAGMTAPTGSLRLDRETPRPPQALLPDARVGIPVLVGLRDAASVMGGSGAPDVRILDFELHDARDMPVPSVILADPAISGPGLVADAAVRGGFAVLIPRKPLAPGRYRVQLRATVGADVIAPAPWTFDVASDASSGAAH